MGNESEDDGYLYLFYIANDRFLTGDVKLGRINHSEYLEPVYDVEYFNPLTNKWIECENGCTQWDDIPFKLFNDTSGVGWQLSVFWFSFLNRYVLMSFDGLIGDIIEIRVASELQGPWSDPYQLLNVSQHLRDMNLTNNTFGYCANLHPELTSVSTDQVNIIFTWSMNGNLWQNVNFGQATFNLLRITEV